MFGSEVLEVVIGLIFVYLMLSLLTTAATEVISRMLEMRSSTLLEGIQNMLDGKKDGNNEIWVELYNHPLIKKLAKDKNKTFDHLQEKTRGFSRGKGLASYIDQKTFSLSIFEILFTDESGKYVTDLRETINKIESPDVQKSLLAMLNEAENDLEKFRENIETWFNGHMERISGWYRRKARLISFILGVLFAFAANADTIGITNGLLRDAALRDAIVQSAGALIEESEDTEIDKNITELQKELLETQLLGWVWNLEKDGADKNDTSGTTEETVVTDIRARPATVGGWLLKVIGIFITAAAISLGAPFWFDMLSKIMSVRETGKRPEPDEPKTKNGQNGQLTTSGQGGGQNPSI